MFAFIYSLLTMSVLIGKFGVIFHSSPLCVCMLSHVQLFTTPWICSPLGSSVHRIFSGRNTGVGCHFLLQRTKVKSENEVAQLCLNPSGPMDCSLTGSSVHGIFRVFFNMYTFTNPPHLKRKKLKDREMKSVA